MENEDVMALPTSNLADGLHHPKVPCPAWAKRCSDYMVQCKACTCGYTGRYRTYYGGQWVAMGGIPEKCESCAKRLAEANKRRVVPTVPDEALPPTMRTHDDYWKRWTALTEGQQCELLADVKWGEGDLVYPPMDGAMVADVQRYAYEHYEEGGWDFIVEAYTSEELWEVIAWSADLAEAIERARSVAGLLGERRDEVRATAW